VFNLAKGIVIKQREFQFVPHVHFESKPSFAIKLAETFEKIYFLTVNLLKLSRFVLKKNYIKVPKYE
jgi:hypothetical protein